MRSAEISWAFLPRNIIGIVRVVTFSACDLPYKGDHCDNATKVVLFVSDLFVSDPAKRTKSAIPGVPAPLMPLSLLTLLGNTVSFVCHQLRWYVPVRSPSRMHKADVNKHVQQDMQIY